MTETPQDRAWGELRSALAARDLKRIDRLLKSWKWGDWCEAQTYARDQGYKPPPVRGDAAQQGLPVFWVSEVNVPTDEASSSSGHTIHCIRLPGEFDLIRYSPDNRIAYVMKHRERDFDLENVKEIWLVLARDAINGQSGFWGTPFQEFSLLNTPSHPANQDHGTEHQVIAVQPQTELQE